MFSSTNVEDGKCLGLTNIPMELSICIKEIPLFIDKCIGACSLDLPGLTIVEIVLINFLSFIKYPICAVLLNITYF